MNERRVRKTLAVISSGMRPFSQKQEFAKRDIAIQGASVRQTWGVDEPIGTERKQLRREPPTLRVVPGETDCELHIRLSEELEFARRMLDITSDELLADPIAVSRHTVSLQYLDKVGQMLGHIANVIRSTDPNAAVEAIGMGDLKARLTRRGAL